MWPVPFPFSRYASHCRSLPFVRTCSTKNFRRIFSPSCGRKSAHAAHIGDRRDLRSARFRRLRCTSRRRERLPREIVFGLSSVENIRSDAAVRDAHVVDRLAADAFIQIAAVNALISRSFAAELCTA